MKINNRQQFLAIVAGAALALLLGDRLVVSPLLASWQERTGRIAQLRKDLNQGALLLDREQTIRGRWAGMRTNMLPDNVSAAENEVLQAFDHWSRVSQISISGIKPQWKRASDDHLTLECRADAFGSIEALTRFLYNVERDPLALRVEVVEVAARDNDGRQLALGLQVSGVSLSSQEP